MPRWVLGRSHCAPEHHHPTYCLTFKYLQPRPNIPRAPDAIKLKNRRLDITPAVAVMAKTEEDVMTVMEFVHQNNSKLDG